MHSGDKDQMNLRRRPSSGVRLRSPFSADLLPQRSAFAPNRRSGEALVHLEAGSSGAATVRPMTRPPITDSTCAADCTTNADDCPLFEAAADLHAIHRLSAKHTNRDTSRHPPMLPPFPLSPDLPDIRARGHLSLSRPTYRTSTLEGEALCRSSSDGSNEPPYRVNGDVGCIGFF